MREDGNKFRLFPRNRRKLHLDQIRPHRLGPASRSDVMHDSYLVIRSLL